MYINILLSSLNYTCFHEKFLVLLNVNISEICLLTVCYVCQCCIYCVQEISSLDAREIAFIVLEQLPDVTNLNRDTFQVF